MVDILFSCLVFSCNLKRFFLIGLEYSFSILFSSCHDLQGNGTEYSCGILYSTKANLIQWSLCRPLHPSSRAFCCLTEGNVYTQPERTAIKRFPTGNLGISQEKATHRTTKVVLWVNHDRVCWKLTKTHERIMKN